MKKTSPAPPRRPSSVAPPAARARGRTAKVLVLLALVCVASIALRLLAGKVLGLPAGSLVNATGRLLVGTSLFSGGEIGIVDARVFRVIEACLVGASLATAGVALQALLRNPLAEPFVLGLSSGANVGIIVQVMLLYRFGMNPGPWHIGALAGALATVTIVFLASRRRGMLDTMGVLLVGIVLNVFNGALIQLFNYLAGPNLRNMTFGLMSGELSEGVSAVNVRVVFWVTLAGIAMLAYLGRSMDAATFSPGEARAMGVNLSRLRTMLFVLSSVLAAGAVVLAGPVAFVGLIAPHLARLALGPSHRPLVIGSALIGAALILLADTITSLLGPWLHIGQIPIGVFTAVIGGVVFLTMLRPMLGKGME